MVGDIFLQYTKMYYYKVLVRYQQRPLLYYYLCFYKKMLRFIFLPPTDLIALSLTVRRYGRLIADRVIYVDI